MILGLNLIFKAMGKMTKYLRPLPSPNSCDFSENLPRGHADRKWIQLSPMLEMMYPCWVYCPLPFAPHIASSSFSTCSNSLKQNNPNSWTICSPRPSFYEPQIHGISICTSVPFLWCPIVQQGGELYVSPMWTGQQAWAEQVLRDGWSWRWGRRSTALKEFHGGTWRGERWYFAGVSGEFLGRETQS